MTLKAQLDEIINTNNFGNIEIKYGKKEKYNISYYTSLLFGDIPERLWKKEVNEISFTGVSGRVDYCLNLK